MVCLWGGGGAWFFGSGGFAGFGSGRGWFVLLCFVPFFGVWCLEFGENVSDEKLKGGRLRV